jgi:hypothetical protein
MNFVISPTAKVLRAATVMVAAAIIWLLAIVPARAEPAKVEVGIFVSSVYDLDFYEETFQAIVWLWFVYDDL